MELIASISRLAAIGHVFKEFNVMTTTRKALDVVRVLWDIKEMVSRVHQP
jgi:hypothetical protein